MGDRLGVLVPSEEELGIRESVAAICARFGREYMRDKVEKGEPVPDMMTQPLTRVRP